MFKTHFWKYHKKTCEIETITFLQHASAQAARQPRIGLDHTHSQRNLLPVVVVRSHSCRNLRPGGKCKTFQNLNNTEEIKTKLGLMLQKESMLDTWCVFTSSHRSQIVNSIIYVYCQYTPLKVYPAQLAFHPFEEMHRNSLSRRNKYYFRISQFNLVCRLQKT